MEISQLQEEVDKAVRAQAPEDAYPYWPPFVILARLIEEVGEVSRELNHIFGPKRRRDGKVDALPEEIGDILFTLACLANSQHVDLEGAARQAIAKCGGRDKDRFRGGKT